MEPESLLLRSQEPATCPYFEPDWSSPFPHPTSLTSILIFSFRLRLGPQSYFLEMFDMLQHSSQDAENGVWEVLTEFVSENLKGTDCLNNLEVNKWLTHLIHTTV